MGKGAQGVELTQFIHTHVVFFGHGGHGLSRRQGMDCRRLPGHGAGRLFQQMLLMVHPGYRRREGSRQGEGHLDGDIQPCQPSHPHGEAPLLRTAFVPVHKYPCV